MKTSLGDDTKPNVPRMDEPTKKALLKTTLLAKIPLGPSISVTCTRLGFVFDAPDQERITYSGLIHKKKILTFLRDLKIPTRG